MSLRDHLIRVLADGEVHSGSALAGTLGVSRSAVWKQIHRLAHLGLEIQAAGGRGYRLVGGLELLDRELIARHLDEETGATCEQLDVMSVTPSTSAALIGEAGPAVGLWRGALAEYQTGGRGRRGRRWLSPFGSGLCMSVSWRFATAPRDLPALSLAAGIGVTRALVAAGAVGLSLKWPNDIVLAGRKLAGILVDVDGDSRGPLRAVIGVGLNLRAPDTLAREVAGEGGLPPGGLDSAVPGGHVERNTLAAGLIVSLCRVLRDFSRFGFASMADEWRRQDFLCGQPVTVHNGAEEICGVACGIAPDGALLLDRPEGIAAILNGDITLRAGA